MPAPKTIPHSLKETIIFLEFFNILSCTCVLSFNLCEFSIIFKFVSLLFFTRFYPLKQEFILSKAHSFLNFLPENAYIYFLAAKLP